MFFCELDGGGCREAKKVGVHLDVLPPSALVGFWPYDLVSCRKVHADRYISELTHGEKRGCFHLDKEASFSDALADSCGRFAKQSVRRPGLAPASGCSALSGDRLQQVDHGPVRFDLPSRGEVVERRPLISHGGIDNHNLA